MTEPETRKEEKERMRRERLIREETARAAAEGIGDEPPSPEQVAMFLSDLYSSQTRLWNKIEELTNDQTEVVRTATRVLKLTAVTRNVVAWIALVLSLIAIALEVF